MKREMLEQSSNKVLSPQIDTTGKGVIITMTDAREIHLYN